MTRRDYPTEESKKLIEDTVSDMEDMGMDDDAGWFKGYIENDQVSRLAYDLDLVGEKLPRGGRICEYGAAPFVLTLSLKRSGYDVVGVDLAPDRFTNIDELGLELEKVNIETEEMPFSESHFDAVIFNELFEHMRKDLLFTLREARRIMKEEGYLFLSTPNLRSIKGIINFLFRSKAYSCAGDLHWEWKKIEEFGHMGHIREYTSREVIHLLEQIRLELDEVIYEGNFSSPSWKGKIANFIMAIFPQFRPNMRLVFRK